MYSIDCKAKGKIHTSFISEREMSANHLVAKKKIQKFLNGSISNVPVLILIKKN